MWRETLDKIIAEKGRYGEKVNTGATETEIRTFTDRCTAELHVELPEEYLYVLQKINGLEYSGFILYGIDEKYLVAAPNQHINGLLEQNEIWHENEWQRQYLFLGESNISWYVYDRAAMKYCELDNPSGSVIAEYRCFSYMLDKLLSDSLL